jgi:hypothetical protein
MKSLRAFGPTVFVLWAVGSVAALAGSSINVAPVISGSPSTTVEATGTYNFTPTASDANGNALTFSIQNRPSWATFNTATGRLSGIAPANVGVTEGVRISVSDGRASASLKPFPVIVTTKLGSSETAAYRPPTSNTAPTISGTPSTTVEIYGAYTFTPAAADANGDPLTFSIQNRPAWANFNTATGRLSGVAPSVQGATENVVISVSDGRASAALRPFALIVTAKSGSSGSTNAAPAISGSPATSVQVSGAYSFRPSAADANGDPLTFSIQNRPSWASFNTSTGQLSGTAPSTATSNGGIVISVSDGRVSTSLPAFTINVTAASNAAPTISGTPGTSVATGAAYTFRPSASDSNGDALSYSIQNRPSWATFSISTGELSGTAPATGGAYSGIVISVSDGHVSAALPAFTINVQAAVSGTASLSWVPPTQNTDGTALTDLSGYRVYFGSSPSSLTQVVPISGASNTSYVVRNLSAGTWYFALSAYSNAGTESARSAVLSKTIR